LAHTLLPADPVVSPPSTESPPAPSLDRSRWFADEVHLHDARLKAYLRGAFPAVRDVDDVVQESYLRIWKACAARPIQSARAFLFRVARNVCLDLLKKTGRTPTEPLDDLSGVALLEETPSAADELGTEEKLQILTDALAALPPRCREIFMLCKFQGYTHGQAADHLGISRRTVDAQVQIGFERLDAELRRRGVTPCPDR
jgi:RNA polymerase sigma factor (sigma-70 family)